MENVNKKSLRDKVQKMQYGGTDCRDVMSYINSISPQSVQLDALELNDLCKKIAAVYSREKLTQQEIRDRGGE